MKLTGKQNHFLRSLGHSLAPVVHIGKKGVDDGQIRAVDAALEQHELIKVRLENECPDDKYQVADNLSEGTKASVAQVIGKTILLYRRHPREPKIKLPGVSAH